MKLFCFILFLFPLFLPAQQKLSAYQQALQQQEARRKAETVRAQAIRNRYRYVPAPAKPSAGKIPPSRFTPKQTRTVQRRVYSSPGVSGKAAAQPERKGISPKPAPVRTRAVQARVYSSPKTPMKIRRNIPSQPTILPRPRPTQKIATVRIGQNVYFYLRDVASYYGMQLRFHKDGVEMYSLTGYRMRFYKKKRTAYINSTLVHLLFPLYLRGNTGYFIHSEDVRVILHSLLRTKRAVQVRHQKLILLDPGHGGSDTGALVPSLREKDMNLVMAYKVRKVLTAFGYKVILTRTGDSTLSLKQRAALCRKWKPDLFVSLHCNAAGDRKVRGIETFAATPRNTPSTGKTKPAHTKPDPGNKFDAENFHLAYLVQRSLLSYTAAPDRGVRHARFLVIREAFSPAILIEMGFLTNKQEVKLFRTEAYQNKMANGIAVGIHLYAKER